MQNQTDDKARKFFTACHLCVCSRSIGCDVKPVAKIQDCYLNCLEKKNLKFINNDHLWFDIRISSQNEIHIDFATKQENSTASTLLHTTKVHVNRLNYFPLMFVSSCYACHIYLQPPEPTCHLIKIHKTLDVDGKFFFPKYLEQLWLTKL